MRFVKALIFNIFLIKRQGLSYLQASPFLV
ncbi:MAG: hypothetical protein ACI81T_002569 [Bacteroidia bacterium]